MQIVETGTGRLLGTVDAAAAHATVHDGAVHLHQGCTYVVQKLDLADDVALVEEASPPYSTTARDTTAISILDTDTEIPWGDARLCFGSVEVTNQVVSFLRRKLITGEVLGETKLDLPPRTLRTRAVWWTVTEDQLDAARVNPQQLGGALHAAEHASIGMLPLFATCDRWDIGGVSVPLHPDTLLPTVFVYDGHPGGAGFAERAFQTAADWLTATRAAIASCECEAGFALPASSRPSAATATTRSTSGAPSGCWASCCAARRGGRSRGAGCGADADRGGRGRCGADTDYGGRGRCGSEPRRVTASRRSGPRPYPGGERAAARLGRDIGDLPGHRTAHQTGVLRGRHPAGRRTGHGRAPQGVIRGGQRRQVRGATRPVPRHDGLAHADQGHEHRAERRRGEDRPDRRRALIAAPSPPQEPPPPP